MIRRYDSWLLRLKLALKALMESRHYLCSENKGQDLRRNETCRLGNNEAAVESPEGNSIPTPRRERSYQCSAQIGLLSTDVSHAGDLRSGRQTSR